MSFGTQIKYDKKKVVAMNGHFGQNQIQDSLLQYVNQYVLCNIYKFPEIYLKVENKKLSKCCFACNDIELIKKEDKLIQFIIKNSPIVDHDVEKEVFVIFCYFLSFLKMIDFLLKNSKFYWKMKFHLKKN